MTTRGYALDRLRQDGVGALSRDGIASFSGVTEHDFSPSCVSEVFTADGQIYYRCLRLASVTELAKSAETISTVAKRRTTTITGNSVQRGDPVLPERVSRSGSPCKLQLTER